MAAACVQVAEALAWLGAELVPDHDPQMWRTFFHEAGSCAMDRGVDSACNAWGRLRPLDNLWLADASVLPSAGDRNPTLTVLAHASRVGATVMAALTGHT